MKILLSMLIPACLTACTAAPTVSVTSLIKTPLTDIPGKEAEMITVEYGPGAADPVHTHNAHGFLYVLEGSVVMQVQGGEAVTLTAGQTFYEAPDDVHIVGRNASATRSAKFVVFLVKEVGSPVFVPAE